MALFIIAILSYLCVFHGADAKGDKFEEGDSFQLPYTLDATSSGEWNVDHGFASLHEHLTKQSQPKVLVMGAAITPSKSHVHQQPENPKWPFWLKIPGISVHGTDYAGAKQNTGHSSFRFVKYIVDAHVMTRQVPENEYDAILSIAVFEHLRYPWLVSRELMKVLKPGGVILLCTHQTFKLHGFPFDYYRFSARALESLFEPSLGSHVNGSWYANEAVYLGDQDKPLSFHPNLHARTALDERAWINVWLYVTKTGPSTTFKSDYPYLVDSKET